MIELTKVYRSEREGAETQRTPVSVNPDHVVTAMDATFYDTQLSAVMTGTAVALTNGNVLNVAESRTVVIRQIAHWRHGK